MNKSAVIFAALIIIGCFLPWFQVGSIIIRNGIENPDAIIILIASAISFVIGVISKKRNTGIHFVLAAVSFAVSFIDVSERGQLFQ